MPTFATVFTPPATPGGLAVSIEPQLSRVVLTWTATSLGANFSHYTISRSTDGGEYVVIAEVGVEGAPGYNDQEAPIGVPLGYRVIVTNIDGLASEPAEGATMLGAEYGWWLVDPGGAADRTFRLFLVDDYRSSSPLQIEDHRALGRPRVLRVRGERLGEEADLSIHVRPEDRAMWGLLKEAQLHPSAYVLLKSPFGEVLRVSLGALSRKRGTAGATRIDVTFTEVA